MNEFEPAEQAPNDIYEYEKTTKGPSRFQAAMVATTGFIIFGGLVGGGAFAMTGGLPGILPVAPTIEVVDPGVTDPAATDPAATDPAATDPAATPSDSASVDPTATPDPTSGAQIVVPPVFGGGDHEGGDDKGKGSEHGDKGKGKHRKPTATANPTADPSATPSFGSDDESEAPDDN